METKSTYVPLCPKCKTEDIKFRGWVRWDAEAGNWYVDQDPSFDAWCMNEECMWEGAPYEAGL